MINFIVHSEHSVYKNLLVDYFIAPITKADTNQIVQISDRTIDEAVNVHFFLEARIVQNVGLKGKNIFISHGIADKRYRITKLVDAFDYIITTGPAWNDKLVAQGISKNKLIMGGYPKLDVLYDAAKKLAVSTYEKPIISWLPTHNCSRAKDLATYPRFETFLSDISKKYQVLKSTHPANNASNKGTCDELVIADVIIADIGSTIYEAWALGKPVVLPTFIIKRAVQKYLHDTFESKIYNEQIGYHTNTKYDLRQQINRALENGMKKESKKFIDSIFDPALLGCSGKSIMDFIKQIGGL